MPTGRKMLSAFCLTFATVRNANFVRVREVTALYIRAAEEPALDAKESVPEFVRHSIFELDNVSLPGTQLSPTRPASSLKRAPLKELLFLLIHTIQEEYQRHGLVNFEHF